MLEAFGFVQQIARATGSSIDVSPSPADLEAFVRRNDPGGEASPLAVAWVHFDAAEKIALAAPAGGAGAEKKEAAAASGGKEAPPAEKKLDKRARMELEKKQAAGSRPDAPPETRAMVDGWRAFTLAEFRLHEIDGHHLFPISVPEAKKAWLQTIVDAIRSIE